MYAIAACGAAGIGLIAGFSLLGSPTHQRALEADSRRIEHLRSIAYELHSRAGSLPISVDELKSDHVDPVSGAAYEYRRVGGTTYELCAVFSLNAERRAQQHTSFWRHGAGRQCFTLDTAKPVP